MKREGVEERRRGPCGWCRRELALVPLYAGLSKLVAQTAKHDVHELAEFTCWVCPICRDRAVAFRRRQVLLTVLLLVVVAPGAFLLVWNLRPFGDRADIALMILIPMGACFALYSAMDWWLCRRLGLSSWRWLKVLETDPAKFREKWNKRFFRGRADFWADR